MQKIILAVAFSFCIILAMGQSKNGIKSLPDDPTKASMADMQQLANMSPSEREAWKEQMLKNSVDNLKKKAKAANITIDETVLPTTKLVPPVKDLKRLAMLPVAPPTRQQLLTQTAKMEAALKTVATAQTVQQVENFSASHSAKEIQNAAIGGWYNNNPRSALLLGIKAVQKDPASILQWNNLAALFNMAGLEHQAIPILQHCLIELPNNSMLLNNIGQAYMGLGDLVKARQFLDKSLSIDDMHPEANHSMALLHIYDKDYEKAVQYLQKEMEIAHRRSSLAQLVKSGHRDRINLAALRKKKMARDGTDKRNFFEEIALGKFKLPNPPMRAEDSERWKAEHAGLMKSINDEIHFWNNLALVSTEALRAEGHKKNGFYADLVNELIRDLGNQYSSIIGIVHEDDVPYLSQLVTDKAKRDHETPCPSPPMDPGNTQKIFEAYEKKCCDLKSPIVDELMYKYNSFILARVQEAQSNYKQYINGLISVIQLDPSEGNKRLVYATVGSYFTFLFNAMQSYQVLDRPMNCKSNMTSKEADDIIASARSIDIKCPEWLKLKLSLKVADLEADCSGFSIEADIYGLIKAGAEKSFESGTSTLYVGAGIDGSFSIAEGEITQKFYIVFDQNNQFADLGMRGSASGNISGAIGAEFTYDIAMNAGFNAQSEVKSEWIESYEKALGFLVKQ
jgi:tetratricopeptide (TPR) repeat protein